MKYSVQIQYTNPSHEHVSLRRRVDTVTRLVEASNEQEALNRAANQQRALGFMIKEAKVVKEKNHDKEGDEETVVAKGTESYPTLKPGQKLKPVKLKMGEGFDPEPKDIAAHLVGKHGKGKVTKDHVDAYEKDRDSNKGIDKEAVMKHVQKMSEEVDQIEEGVATAQKVMDRAKVVADTNPDPKKRFAASGLAQKAMLRTINPTGVNTGIVRGGGNKTYRMVTGKVPPYQLTKKTGVSEEVEQIDEVKAVKAYDKEGKLVGRYRSMEHAKQMKPGHTYKVDESSHKPLLPAQKAVQAKVDAESKKQLAKKPQAGTLAAKKIKEAAEKMVKKVRAMKDDKKSTKTAEIKLENEKKKVNKINMEPSVEVKG